MTWKVRHQGSPQSVEGLTLAQVVEGLQDGLWEPTDEVMGPGEAEWVAIENHPQLAEIAADIEPPPPREYDDETHLDMNPLIDVCLVLLVFFILTTSYTALQKRMEAAEATSQKDERAVRPVTEKEIKEQMIQTSVKLDNGRPVYRVEGQVTDPDHLIATLKGFVSRQHKTDLLLEFDGKAQWGDVLRLQDAAKAAGMDRIHYLAPQKK
jgi:biopolymer transport protein ExbD